MATEVMTGGRAAALETRAPRARGWSRPAALGLALGLLAMLSGDHTGWTAGAVQGIDPLEILNLQVKPNVVFVLDSSLDMGLTPEGSHYVGGDDPMSRFYMAKLAMREVVDANRNYVNMGLVDLSAAQANLTIDDPSSGVLAGPFVYVSGDPTASEWVTFFDDLESSFPNFSLTPRCDGGFTDPNCSEQVFSGFDTREFNGFGSQYQGRTYVVSRLFWNDAQIDWNKTPAVGNKDRSMVDVVTFDCSAAPPPSGLLGDDTDEFNNGTEARPCFRILDTTGRIEPATFYLASATYHAPTDAGECDGTLGTCLLEGVPACNAASSNAPALLSDLRLQNPIDGASATGIPLGFPAQVPPPSASTDARGTQPNAAGGAQIGGRRRLSAGLRAAQLHYTSSVFASRPGAVDGLQRNFVIVIASGADAGVDGFTPESLAATMAGTGTGANDITTLVVTINGQPGFAGSAEDVRLNALQSAGTRGQFNAAFGGSTAETLKGALRQAMAQAIATGTFSTESSVTESIFEYAPAAGAFDPRNPDTRYNGRVPTLLQSSFDMPGFTGHLRAFINATIDGKGPTVPKWDAGFELLDRVWNGPTGTDGLCPNGSFNPVSGVANHNTCAFGLDGLPGTLDDATVDWTFGQLAWGAVNGDPLEGSYGEAPQFLPPTAARLKRRILTTTSHGVFAYPAALDEPFEIAAVQCPVPLWPPTTTTSVGSCSYSLPVAPTTDTPGLLDEDLGVATATFEDLRSRFGACLNVSDPAHPCNDADPAVRTARARREGREIILAYTAGAQLATTAGAPRRNASNELLYVARPWILAESTLAVPAVVPPPLEARPSAHTAEYLLFRDGITPDVGTRPERSASGFGLRNADKDQPTLTGPEYEPLMSVVYHAANDMLHAFRAGPCNFSTVTCPISSSYGSLERGGEELWGFVPHDLLPRLADRMVAQGRGNHTYMLASSLRFSDVFVPGEWTDSVTGRTFLGRWRTILVFGRGIAGQHYTAIDITAPGQFTRTALDTQAPFVIWSRGNPDTQDGTPSGAANSLLDPDGDDGDNDAAAYATMGETWSVPALAAVPPGDFFNKEFAMFMGSGYSPAPSSTVGNRFYAVDALTGDILYAPAAPDTAKSCASIQSGETCPVPNALVANAAAYVAVQLANGFVGNPAASTASLVYIGDLHGRMWKFITSNPGVGLVHVNRATGDAGADDSPDQPIGSAAALLNINNKPHVYWETGNDLRVIPPADFNLVAARDDGADIDPTLSATRLFRYPLTGSLQNFRGTAQPATAFNAQGVGRAFFVATRFNNQNSAGGNCRPTFDSVIFAVGAVTGNAVYDLDNSGTIGANDVSKTMTGTKVNAIRAASGQIVLDTGMLGGAPAPPPAPGAAPSANEGSSGDVQLLRLKTGTGVCKD